VKSGSKVRIPRKGRPGQSGGLNGDLYLDITVEHDPVFERDGDDLRVNPPAWPADDWITETG
jgi:molecular chaperone DnaJ